MQLRRHTEQTPETSRAEIILASKPTERAGRAKGRRGLLDVVVPRHEPRQNHERNEDRRVLAGVSARVALGRATFEASVANLSSNGMMIACERIIPIGAEVSAEIEGCAAIPMTVRWVRGGRIGLEFLAETTIVAQAGVQQFIIDTIRAEAAATRFGSGIERPAAGPEKRGAGLRHALMWVCELAAGGGIGAARLRNISRSGALVSFDDDIAPMPGETVTLVMGEASRFAAQVRWAHEGLAGLHFADHFPVEMLIDQPCAQIVEPVEAAPGQPRYASREEAMRIEYTGVARPYEAPAMDYQPLTLRELYATLYNPVDPIEP